MTAELAQMTMLDNGLEINVGFSKGDHPKHFILTEVRFLSKISFEAGGWEHCFQEE